MRGKRVQGERRSQESLSDRRVKLERRVVE